MVCQADNLPNLITAIKDGWQLTGQNGAVVSSLLAAVAAQLIGFFKDPENYTHASEAQQRVVVALCYYAIFFNIGAAIASFVMMDYLGEVPYHAAKSADSLEVPKAGRIEGSANSLLKRYSGSPSVWAWTLFHWLLCLVLGILTLIAAILTYVWLEEMLWMKVTMLIAVIYILVFPIVLLWPR